jgi:uncharacterized protein (TIGR03437 family)
VFHQEFRGPLTPADPALPGEYLHAYMTGLGDVQPRPATGSPAVGLSFATRPLCYLQAPLVAQEFAPVAFAGLAPGTLGMYQVDIGLPADFPAAVGTLNCVTQPFGGALAGDSGTIFVGKR